MAAMKPSIKAYTLPQLEALMRDLGQPAFRAKQLYEWLYKHGASSYDQMTNLSLQLRSALAEGYSLGFSVIQDKKTSKDGTIKYLLSYDDGVCVETVAIPSRNKERLTVCFSTQAGCAIQCAFCATGQEGLTRNLLPGEMVDQVIAVRNDIGRRVTNIVGMGQGEPFLNYDNVIAALRICNDPKSLGIGARHISVSTCGIIPGIDRFSNEPEQFTLAVSLHAASQTVRDSLMPKVSSFSLDNLKSALRRYIRKTKRRVTLEYLMIKGVNDSSEDLAKVKSFCSGLLCHVNLIPVNPVPGVPFKPSPQRTMNEWVSELQKSGTETTIRDSRGADVHGACGQLKNTYHRN